MRNTTHVKRFNTRETGDAETEHEQIDQTENSYCPDSEPHDLNPKMDSSDRQKKDRPQRTRRLPEKLSDYIMN